MAKKMRVLRPASDPPNTGICHIFSTVAHRFSGPGDLGFAYTTHSHWDAFMLRSLLDDLFHAETSDSEFYLGVISDVQMPVAEAPSDVAPVTWSYGAIPDGVEGPGYGARNLSSLFFAHSAVSVFLYQNEHLDNSAFQSELIEGVAGAFVEHGDLIAGFSDYDLLRGTDLFPSRDLFLGHLFRGEPIAGNGQGWIELQDRAGNTASERLEIEFDEPSGGINISASIKMLGTVELTTTIATYDPHWAIYDAASAGRPLFRARIDMTGTDFIYTVPPGRSFTMGEDQRILVWIYFD